MYTIVGIAVIYLSVFRLLLLLFCDRVSSTYQLLSLASGVAAGIVSQLYLVEVK